MKLNNKGITLTEIIISIALISIVLIFLFSLLVSVNDINKESEVNSTYLINKSLILKNIEQDLSKVDPDTGIKLINCGSEPIKNNFYSSYVSSNGEYGAYDCIKIDYNNGKDAAKLGLFYYDKVRGYILSYVYNNIRNPRTFPDFQKYNVNKSNGDLYNPMEIKLGSQTCGTNLSGCATNSSKRFMTITIPIIGSDEKDYSIIISYYGKVSIG